MTLPGWTREPLVHFLLAGFAVFAFLPWAHLQRGVTQGYGPNAVTLVATPLYHAAGALRIATAAINGTGNALANTMTGGTGGDTLYGPIKSFLIKASQGLHLELRGTGVHVTALCPGYTLTEFHDVNGSREQVSSAYPAWMWMDAARVARIGAPLTSPCRSSRKPNTSRPISPGDTAREQSRVTRRRRRRL